MIIKTDKEWEQVLNQLFDTFLKVNWINALDSINQVKQNIEILESNQEENGNQES